MTLILKAMKTMTQYIVKKLIEEVAKEIETLSGTKQLNLKYT